MFERESVESAVLADGGLLPADVEVGPASAQTAFRALKDYEKQKKDGLDPTFDPLALDINGATFWENYDPVTGSVS